MIQGLIVTNSERITSHMPIIWKYLDRCLTDQSQTDEMGTELSFGLVSDLFNNA